MTAKEIILQLQYHGTKKNIKTMQRFGIPNAKAFGVSAHHIRKLAKQIGKNHTLAVELWNTGFHEARILAALIAEPAKMTKRMATVWVNDLDNWAVCDACCAELFDKTKFAYTLPWRWARSKKEFTRRAGFVMIAALALHDKSAEDEALIQFFPLLKLYASDNRNFVKKAINWSLRQVGKRNLRLNKLAIEISREIKALPAKPAKWIASDALRELTSPRTRYRIKSKQH